MLPSIQAPDKHPEQDKARYQCFSNLNRLVLEKDNSQVDSSFLPLISEGSLTSFVSSTSSRSRWKERIKLSQSEQTAARKQVIKKRGKGFKEYINPHIIGKSHSDQQITGVKKTDLQLKFDSRRSNKSWSLQNPNPRLLKLQNITGKFQTNLSRNCRNISDYTAFTKSTASPHIEFLYRKKQMWSKEPTSIVTSGATARLNARFQCPPVSIKQIEHVLDPPRLPQLSQHSLPVPYSCPVNEATHIQRKTPERVALLSRDQYKRWEHRSLRKASMQSSSSSSMGDQFRAKLSRPTPSPPKMTQRKARGMSLETLREKAKVCTSRTDSNKMPRDRRRRSTHTNDSSKTKVTKKSRDERSLSGSPHDGPQGDVIADGLEVSKNDIDEQQVWQVVLPVAMEMDLVSVSTTDNKDALTVEDVVSIATTPNSLRRVATPRILKIQTDRRGDDDETITLQKMFTKLDNDGDGHLSFEELKRSLPNNLTKRQLGYLRKIYLMACESTFFGFEEFLAVHQMCDVIAHVNDPLLEAFQSIDFSELEVSIPACLEVFHNLDKKQKGVIDSTSFMELVASLINAEQDSDVMHEVLKTIGKSENDVVSSIELLVYLPYLTQMSANST